MSFRSRFDDLIIKYFNLKETDTPLSKFDQRLLLWLVCLFTMPIGFTFFILYKNIQERFNTHPMESYTKLSRILDIAGAISVTLTMACLVWFCNTRSVLSGVLLFLFLITFALFGILQNKSERKIFKLKQNLQ